MDSNNNKITNLLKVLRDAPLEVSIQQIQTWVRQSEGRKQQIMKPAKWFTFWLGKESSN